MNVYEIYAGSDGEATKRLYAELEKLGSVGIIAVNLFRAVKCSSRAKVYRGRGYRSDAYERKNWSLHNLCGALTKYAIDPDGPAGENFTWGWKEDPAQEFHKWVLYVELPTGQVSFHAGQRGVGPDYPGEWDGQHLSAERIIRFVQGMLGGENIQQPTSNIEHPTSPAPAAEQPRAPVDPLPDGQSPDAMRRQALMEFGEG